MSVRRADRAELSTVVQRVKAEGVIRHFVFGSSMSAGADFVTEQVGRDETVFPGREVVLKQSAGRVPPLKEGEAQTRGTVMLVAILNSIYRHFLTAAIVGMAMTQGRRR